MDPLTLAVFGFVYLGMVLGRIPGLAVDRTGIALLGAIVLLATNRISMAEASSAVDLPTIGLLLGLMVVSAQFRLGGLYTAITRRIASVPVGPGTLLGIVIAVAGVLSALLANDIVCLAVAPLLIEGCCRRRLNPVPFLLGLACASNIGSAATLIGNPQNMLIGQKLQLSFAGYLIDGGAPAGVGLFLLWVILRWLTRGRWHADVEVGAVHAPPFDAWQSIKGVIVLVGLVAGFLHGGIPREILALTAAGVVLTSRRMHSRQMLSLVDWQLLVLFISLFIVNHALQTTSAFSLTIKALADARIDATRPGWLFVITAVLSNIVSNVPAVILLLPAATHPLSGPVLALSSTLAGNLFIPGSIANIIVIDQAARYGIHITWRQHARVGVPVTLVTLGVAAAWLWLVA
ncbi:MAG: anion transporter [Phycisphaerae bacterium]|nr:anion transporter [Phycisphaerae bacterium]